MFILTLLGYVAIYGVALALPALLAVHLIRYNDRLRRRSLNDFLKKLYHTKSDKND